MSIENAREHLTSRGISREIRELPQSSATVELAAQALGCEPARIAKTLSFIHEEQPLLIVAAGDARIDNKSYRNYFGAKAKMIPFDHVEEYIGHAPGGVCPFGVARGVAIYLDESLKRFTTVFPAAGSGNSCIELNLEELEQAAGSEASKPVWINVCRDWQSV